MRSKLLVVIAISLQCAVAVAGDDSDRHEGQLNALYEIIRSVDDTLIYSEQLNKKRYDELLEDLDRKIDFSVNQIELYRHDKNFENEQRYINEALARVKKLRQEFPSTAIRASGYDNSKQVLAGVTVLPPDSKQKQQSLFSASFFQYPGLDSDNYRIEFFESGAFKAEWGFVFEPNIEEGNSNRKPEDICQKLRSNGFMELPETIAPQFVGLHGPEFRIEAECDQKLWHVLYSPEFEKGGVTSKMLSQMRTFVETWTFLWGHSKAQVKMPPLDGRFFSPKEMEGTKP